MCEWNLKSHQIEKGFAHLPSTPPLFGFKIFQNVNSVRVYLWVLEVSLLTALPPRALVPPVFLGPHLVSSSNSPQLMEMMHTLSPIRCLVQKRDETSRPNWMVFCCWRCLCFGWFWAFHCGVIDWLPLMDMKSQNRSTWDVLKRENRPTCQPQLVSLPDFWTTNSIESCHVFIFVEGVNLKICWPGYPDGSESGRLYSHHKIDGWFLIFHFIPPGK